jgi:tripartite-type tricarboxylate transporter receptor subunit TctC
MMAFVRRAGLACALLVAALPFLPGGVLAQPHTIKLIVPYPPASGPDILSRLMAEQIGRAQSATVVVENRPGGGTVIGTEAAARSAPDGNTVLLVANSFVINPVLKPQSYDVSKSFDPVCYLAATPMVLVVQASSPYKKLNDLIGAARERPGSLQMAAAPNSSLQVAYEVLKRSAKVDMTFVPFAGTAPAINSLMGGHVTAVFADYPTVVGHLKSGTLRALLTASPKRVPALPDVPTFVEAGHAKHEAEIFYGLVTPAKTPPGAVKQLQDLFGAAIRAPDVQPKLALQGLFPVGRCGASFGDYMRRMVEEYARVVKETGMKAN